MIIKSMSRKSNAAQLIKYASRYVLKENDKESKQESAIVLLRHNLRSKSVQGYISEFKENESYRVYKRKDSVVLFHTVLSFSPDDQNYINNTMLKDMAKKFVDLRSPNCVNLAVAHLEREHKHIHILTSAVQVNGKSSRVSKQEFAHILNELENYQQEKYPELIHSKNSHTKTKVVDKVQLQKTRNSKKLSLLLNLENAYQLAQSQEEFIKSITDNKHEPYYRNERLQGVLVDGKKFRLSSLGFDNKKLEELKEKETSFNSTFDEIQSIRNTPIKTKEMEVVNTKGDNVESELDSIQSIRRKTKERDGLERGLGNPHKRFETEMSFDR
jgi:Relaxase/Mobilisation nuclease domain